MGLQRFDGAGGRWGDWRPRLEAYTALLGFEEVTREAAESSTPVSDDLLGDAAEHALATLPFCLPSFKAGAHSKKGV